MKQNKLADKAQITLPRGTILTPSARSFLGEHQIKIKQGDSDVVKAQNKVPQNNIWLQDIRITYPSIDFDRTTGFATPLVNLQYCLRKQLLLLLNLINTQKEEVDGTIISELVVFVNNLVVVTYDQLTDTQRYSVENLKINELKLSSVNILQVFELNQSFGKMAQQLNTWRMIQPNIIETSYYQAIVVLESMLQEWVQMILEGGDGNARFKHDR
jgi:hypothetical protein